MRFAQNESFPSKTKLSNSEHPLKIMCGHTLKSKKNILTDGISFFVCSRIKMVHKKRIELKIFQIVSHEKCLICIKCFIYAINKYILFMAQKL